MVVAGLTVVGAIGLMFIASRADAAIYWSRGLEIGRVNLDGSVFDPQFLSGPTMAGGSSGSIAGLEIDGAHVYWANHSNGAIGRAEIDGSNRQPSLISETGGVPFDVAVDTRYVYWSSRGMNSLGRAQLDGSEPDPEFIGGIESPCAVAVDGTHIYWTDESEGTISRADIGGFQREVLVDGLTEPCGLALTETHLFWADGYGDTIGRARLDGTEASSTFIVGADYPTTLAVHAGYVYWINSGWSTGSPKEAWIGRAALNGTNVNQHYLGGLEYPWGIAVDGRLAVPRTPAPPIPPSSFQIGKLKRNKRTGAVRFPIDVPNASWISVTAGGLRATIFPERIVGRGYVRAGRKWVRLAPTRKRGNGSRCVLKMLRRGHVVKLTLDIHVAESGKALSSKQKKIRVFRSRRPRRGDSRRKRRTVNCLARPL